MWPEEVWACPACKEALFDPEQLPQRFSTARGYAVSIGLLLAVPFGLVSGTTALLIRASRRKQQAAGSAQESSPPEGEIDTPALSR